MPAGPSRREVLAAGGAALGWFLIGGNRVWATPADAASAGFSPQVLTVEQVQALDSIGEAMVPGATQAGLAAFVDNQLEAGPESKLMAKYVGVPVEQQTGFYRLSLDAVGLALQKKTADEVLAAMAADAVPGWNGPPASYVMFLLRADALDVVYGTQAGFAQLRIPYSAHILPEANW